MTINTKPAPAKAGGSRTKLAAVAADMRRRAAADAYAHTKLAHGLEIILQRQADYRWRLACARDGVDPSDAEIQIVSDAFSVPGDAEQERSLVAHCHPKTGRQIIYHRVQITWQERS